MPLLRSPDTTSGFMAALIAFLNVQLAPRITRHGVFVEVYGEGILLVGDSGVGKSETAIELVKRGASGSSPTMRWRSAGFPIKPWWVRRRRISGILSS